MAYSIDSLTEDCYPDSAVLVNKFDIRDEAKLNEIEGIITAARGAEWLAKPLVSSFDFSHYLAIHKFLFSEIYDWAGQVRSVNMQKKGTSFCPADQIKKRAAHIFARLSRKGFLLNLPRTDFIEELVDLYCSTNELHPFREGNGRTQRLFLVQLAQAAGYHLDFAKMDPDLLMIATIQSSQGVTDLLLRVLTEGIS